MTTLILTPQFQTKKRLFKKIQIRPTTFKKKTKKYNSKKQNQQLKNKKGRGRGRGRGRGKVQGKRLGLGLGRERKKVLYKTVGRGRSRGKVNKRSYDSPKFRDSVLLFTQRKTNLTKLESKVNQRRSESIIKKGERIKKKQETKSGIERNIQKGNEKTQKKITQKENKKSKEKTQKEIQKETKREKPKRTTQIIGSKKTNTDKKNNEKKKKTIRSSINDLDKGRKLTRGIIKKTGKGTEKGTEKGKRNGKENGKVKNTYGVYRNKNTHTLFRNSNPKKKKKKKVTKAVSQKSEIKKINSFPQKATNLKNKKIKNQKRNPKKQTPHSKLQNRNSEILTNFHTPQTKKSSFKLKQKNKTVTPKVKSKAKIKTLVKQQKNSSQKTKKEDQMKSYQNNSLQKKKKKNQRIPHQNIINKKENNQIKNSNDKTKKDLEKEINNKKQTPKRKNNQKEKNQKFENNYQTKTKKKPTGKDSDQRNPKAEGPNLVNGEEFEHLEEFDDFQFATTLEKEGKKESNTDFDIDSDLEMGQELEIENELESGFGLEAQKISNEKNLGKSKIGNSKKEPSTTLKSKSNEKNKIKPKNQEINTFNAPNNHKTKAKGSNINQNGNLNQKKRLKQELKSKTKSDPLQNTVKKTIKKPKENKTKAMKTNKEPKKHLDKKKISPKGDKESLTTSIVQTKNKLNLTHKKQKIDDKDNKHNNDKVQKIAEKKERIKGGNIIKETKINEKTTEIEEKKAETKQEGEFKQTAKEAKKQEEKGEEEEEGEKEQEEEEEEEEINKDIKEKNKKQNIYPIDGGKKIPLKDMSYKTIQKAKLYKKYLQQRYVENFFYYICREKRLKKLKIQIQNDQMNEIESQKKLQEYYQKEHSFLRAKRTIMGLEDFTILGKIGQGGYGEVFLCRKNDTKELLALKRMEKSLIVQTKKVDNIMAERHILAEHYSSWLVNLSYSFQDHKYLYLAMEFLRGGDLKALLMNVVFLDENSARFYAAEMLLSIEELHSIGYIHRDIKPENYLINYDGHLKLTDFGLSRKYKKKLNFNQAINTITNIYLKERNHRDSNNNSEQNGKKYEDCEEEVDTEEDTEEETEEETEEKTEEEKVEELREGEEKVEEENKNNVTKKDNNKTSNKKKRKFQHNNRKKFFTVVGSPDYISPDILNKKGYTKSVDLWSFGCIFFEMLTGFPPFSGENAEETLENVLHSELALENPLDDETGEEIIEPVAWDLISKLLTKEEKKTEKFGIEEIKNHPFFEDVDWDDLNDYIPPFVPTVEDELDVSYFDTSYFDDDEVTFELPEKLHPNRNIKLKRNNRFAGYSFSRFDGNKSGTHVLFEK
ncbi:cell cycle protein kinase dbf2-related [Anaeramoeba flamelloides]|uniref:non-specific serine/threonine protein kinase n=1 Tax=Anaeramoeba flamelloides TaxID=1746091 RepID=A0AAV7YFD6_9EUKA|nr:cell cycle protein kinase dbf2-related [Anaeramoeba flamelloides]